MRKFVLSGDRLTMRSSALVGSGAATVRHQSVVVLTSKVHG